MTLSDVSPGMLAVSRELNPDCEHVRADMRRLELAREFDAVFVHDAICYMTTEADLRSAFETAFRHCRPGGTALFVPDYTKETFRASTDSGGHDAADGRGLRYLEWAWDPDPSDTRYLVDYAYLLREADGRVQVHHDRHLEGLFPRSDWLRLLGEVGFEARARPLEHSEVDYAAEMFLGRRPTRGGAARRVTSRGGE
jgi:SAM-dependent methyltransferase